MSLACQKDFELTVAGGTCPVWGDLVWTAPTIQATGFGNYSFITTPVAPDVGSVICDVNAPMAGDTIKVTGSVGSLSCNAPSVCHCIMNVVFSSIIVWEAGFEVYANGNLVAHWDLNGKVDGNYTVPFDIPAGPCNIEVRCFTSYGWVAHPGGPDAPFCTLWATFYLAP